MQFNSATSLDSRHVSGSARANSITNASDSRNHLNRSPAPRLVPSDLIDTLRNAARNDTDNAKAHQWAQKNGYGTAIVISHQPIERSPGAGSTYVLSCYASSVVSNELVKESDLADIYENNPDNTAHNWATAQGYESGRLNGETDHNRLGIACIRTEVHNKNTVTKLKELKLVGSNEFNGN